MGLSRRRERLVHRLGRRSTRERDGLVLVEGVKTVVDVLSAGGKPRFALVSPRLDDARGGSELLERLEVATEVERITEAEMATLSDTDTPQGVLVVCVEPAHGPETLLESGGRYLLLDAVQDPGNVGTLIRAATAFSLDGVMALDGTADPWNPKVVRASAGASFRIPVCTGSAEEVLALLDSRAIPLLVADAAGEPVDGWGRGGAWALAVGNEGGGARASVMRAAARSLGIPMPGPAGSLNVGVAGSILLYALTFETSS